MGEAPTMSLRGSAAQHLHNEARSAEFTDGWDGWMEWDGMGHQKCPSMFFILCEYIEHVYIYLYIYSKIAANILMTFKIRIFHRPFLNAENVLSPEGTLRKQIPMGSI